MNKIIFEKAINVIHDLVIVEKYFAVVKKDPNRQTINEFQKILNTVFDTSVFFHIITAKNDLYYNNVFVFCILGTENNISEITIDKIKLLNIERIDLYFGKGVIEICTPEELTALLLHEIGHVVFMHNKFLRYVDDTLYYLQKLFFKNLFVIFLMTLYLHINALIFLFFLRNGISLYNHTIENFADSFATKYGYGDNLITALNKLENIGIKQEINDTENKNFFKQIFLEILSKLSRIFFQPSTHPPHDKRIEKIYNEIFDKYSKNYKLSPEIEEIISRLKK